MQKAYGAAKGMQQVERLTDVDIAEVTESKALWVGVESMTDPLDAFMRVLYALDWIGLDNGDKAATYAWLDGRYGDPFEIARGKFLLGNGDNGTGKTEKRDIMERVPKELQADAKRFAGVLNRARALARERRFFNWQVAFPGLWTQWESIELHGGFDAVVGNPPYVRQELIRDIKPALKRAFPDTWDGTAYLYVYFFDQGLRLLKPGGRLSYVVTNKWLRAGYAEKLRELLAGRSWLEFVADFGHAKRFFPAADVFPSVVVLRKPVAGPGAPPAPTEAQICVIPRDDVPDKGLDEAVAKATYPLPRAHFTKESWTLEPPAVMALLDKIRRNGVPLKEYAGVVPYRGILTGFNEAFLIDAATRDRLIAQEPAASEIIRPYLRGQDISRWSTPDSGLYMIVMKSSGDHPWPWADAPDQAEAERRFKKAYPALHRHFKQFEELKEARTGKPRGLRHREDHGRWWWELRPCAYYEAFEKPKTLYVDITWTPSFQVDARSRFTSNTCYFLPTATEAVAASLNAPIGWWYSWRKAQHGKDEALRYVTSFMETYPVAPIAKRQEGKIAASVADLSKLVDQTQIAERTFNDWLRHEFGLAEIKGALVTPSMLDAESLVSVLRDVFPRKRKLTGAEIAELKREHTATIEPARRARAEIFALERKLSDLVNAAYGLTPEEVQLMWATAPPRMPFTPAGLDTPVEREDGGNGEEDES